MKSFLATLASLLIVGGVVLIASAVADPTTNVIPMACGVAALTIGIRVAIDVSGMRRP